MKLEDFFDAILYLGPIRSISNSSIAWETVSDEAYFTEAARRDTLWIGQFQETLKRLREKYFEETE
jgi:hypothetical protein